MFEKGTLRESHLFLVRLFYEAGEDLSRQGRIRGKVQHLVTGRTAVFEDWPTLSGLLIDMAQQPGADRDPSGSQEGAKQ